MASFGEPGLFRPASRYGKLNRRAETPAAASSSQNPFMNGSSHPCARAVRDDQCGCTFAAVVPRGGHVSLVSLAPSEQHPGAAVVDRTVFALALVSGALFGLFYIAFSRVSEDAGMWPLTIERAASAVVLLVLALVLTRGVAVDARRLLPRVLVIALLEVAATIPLLLALQRGPVAIATVVTSLYPVTTVLLAAFVLRERLSLCSTWASSAPCSRSVSCLRANEPPARCRARHPQAGVASRRPRPERRGSEFRRHACTATPPRGRQPEIVKRWSWYARTPSPPLASPQSVVRAPARETSAAAP